MNNLKNTLEADTNKWECIVKKEKENGKIVYNVYEKADNFFVATFFDEQMANEFVREYPKLKERYLKAASEAEAKKKQLIEKAKTEKNQSADAELDRKIEESLKEIYT